MEKDIFDFKIMLTESAIIHNVEHNLFLKPSSVVLHMSDNKEIPPYIMTFSQYYGKHIDLFEQL